MAPHPNNFLAAEPHLVSRLRESLGPEVYVLTEAEVGPIVATGRSPCPGAPSRARV